MLKLAGMLWSLLSRVPLLSKLAAFLPGGSFLAAGSAVFSFFASPLGRWVGVALIGLGLYLAGDIHRARIDHAEWTASVKAADEARDARDAAIKQQVSADAARRIAEIQQEADTLKKQVADYESAIASHGGDVCRATPGASQRLRGL